MWTITGLSHHRAVWVTWRHGYLAGDTELIAEVQRVSRPEGFHLRSTHPCALHRVHAVCRLHVSWRIPGLSRATRVDTTKGQAPDRRDGSAGAPLPWY